MDAWELAAGQAQLISTKQLTRLGLSKDAILHRRRRGRLWPYRRGVWAVGHPEKTPQRDRMAAVLACGEDCALAGWAAAFHLSLSERAPRRLEVVGPLRNSTRKGPKDVLLHLTERLPPTDVITVDGVRVTSVLRTLFDCKAPPGLIRQAQRLHDLDLGALRDYALTWPPQEHRRAHVLKAIAALVPSGEKTQTEREVRFLEIGRRHGFPHCEPQHEIGPYRVDFFFPQHALAVEIDDRSHATEAARAHDARRERFIKRHVADIVHFTLGELFGDEALIAAETHAALRSVADRKRS